MRFFFNRHILFYAAIVLVATLLEYYMAHLLFAAGKEKVFVWVFFVYLFLIFTSAFLISRKDVYQRYAGLNYHLMTYILSNGIPLLIVWAGWLPKEVMSGIFSAMLFWGIGILFHVAMYIFVFRKRGIRNYDKDDVFQ